MQTLRDLLSLLAIAGNGAQERKEFALAESRFKEQLRVAAVARPLMPGSADLEEQEVMAHHGLAGVLAAQGRFADALVENEKVVTGVEAILTANPQLKRLENRRAMAVELQGAYRVGLAQTLEGDEAQAAWRLAKKDLTRAVELFEALEAEGTNTGTAAEPHQEAKALLETVNQALKKK